MFEWIRRRKVAGLLRKAKARRMNKLRSLLLKHEGLRLTPYRDTVGKMTIGCGRNLDDVGISQIEALLMLNNDLDRIQKEAIENFTWFKSIDTVRQDVVLNMLFNLGLSRFLKFRRFISWMSVQNYEKASEEMLNSLWATQVGYRAKELSTMMLTEMYPIEK